MMKGSFFFHLYTESICTINLYIVKATMGGIL